MNDWPIKEYLKNHMNNKWYYQRHPKRPLGGTSKYIDFDDISNFGSEAGDSNKEEEKEEEKEDNDKEEKDNDDDEEEEEEDNDEEDNDEKDNK